MRNDRRRFLGLLAASPWPVSCAARTAVRDAPVAAPPTTPEDLSALATELEAELTGRGFALPDLREERVIRQLAGVRPYRRGGIRVEGESHGGFPLFHNYGHGGGGLTTAWGCAEEVARMKTMAGFVRGSRVTVVGAGIIGLTTALRLQEDGHRVRLVFRETTPHTVSDVAGGQWAPSLMAWGSGPSAGPRRDRILRDSLRRLRAEIERDVGVREVPNFVAMGYGASVGKMAGEYLPDATWHDAIPIRGLKMAGTQVDTLLIEPSRYLAALWERLRRGGVEEQVAELAQLDEVRQFGDDFAVIATGMGARELCQDSAMRPIRGQLVLLEPQDLGYLFSHAGGYLFSRGDALVLGGTVERDVEDPTPTASARERILSRHRRFFAPQA